MKCKADRVDGGYVLNGNKMWCTNGPVAQTLVVYAKTNITAGSSNHCIHHREGNAGVLVVNLVKFKVFSTTQKLDKLGMRGSDTCELVFENCFAPKENVLGEVGKGLAIASMIIFINFRIKSSLCYFESMSCMSGLVLERLVLAAGPLGIMQACLDVVLPYVRQREQFGRPIGEFQFIQVHIVEKWFFYNHLAILLHVIFRHYIVDRSSVTGESCRHIYFIVLKLAWKQDNIFHFRAYVYSVARDCDNGKVNAKDCAGIILTAAERQPKLLCS
ncbi:hypothetical protein S83_020175, partial [Arachis hypogaea]